MTTRSETQNEESVRVYRVTLSVVFDMDESEGLPSREAIFENMVDMLQHEPIDYWIDRIERMNGLDGVWEDYSHD